MRTYGGRLINTGIRRILNDRQELRDAVVYDVDSTNKYCRVKIQGSNTYIKAYYNENWGSTPEWLKPGNAVRISHPGGNKGRIEVVGHGILRPTAIPGGSVEPPEPDNSDAILAGIVALATDPASMQVNVTVGTYRIDGVTYILGAVYMGDSDIVMGRTDMVMGGSGGTVTFDAAHASQFRYDLIVAGVGGLAVVKGTTSSGEPTMPSIPADHVLVGWVLFYPGLTEITQADVNRTYSDPISSSLNISVSKRELWWDGALEDPPEDTYSDITLQIRDQYGRTKSGQYSITATIQTGNGTLSHGGNTSTSSLTVGFAGSSVTIRYTRKGDGSDSSPLILFGEQMTGLGGGTYLMLYDWDDVLMV